MASDNANSTERDVQSVKRALGIIEIVAASGEAGVTGIAKGAGLHVATTHNILRTLTKYHYLENRGGRYRIGGAVLALAQQGDSMQGMPELLRPFLERISRDTGEAASSATLIGEALRIVAFQPGTQAITIHFPQWMWPQPLCLASGRLLLSELPEDEWGSFIEFADEAEPGRSAAEWEEELRGVSEQGFCCVQHPGQGGQTGIAFPVRSRTGRVIVTLGASAPTFRVTPELCDSLFESVRAAAVELSEQFGCASENLEKTSSARPPRWEEALPSLAKIAVR